MSRKALIGLAAVLGAGLLLILAVDFGYRRLQSITSLEGVTANLREQYPDVEPSSPTHLARLAPAVESGDVLVADVRTEEEFAVSHLPGSVPVPEPGALTRLLRERERPPGTIVMVDATGHRAAKRASELQGEGVGDVTWLAGGIFAWANEGRKLVDKDGEIVQEVHPYHPYWSRLLDETRRAPLREGAPAGEPMVR